MSFIHASFWNKKIKADSFDDLRIKISDFRPSKVDISIKTKPWNHQRPDGIKMNLCGSFSDIDKELRVLQKKFKNF